MRAVRVHEPGGPDVLRLSDVDRPEPGEGAVRVRVRAAGLNRADLLQRMGRYPAPAGAPPDIPGLEFAGEIDAVGAGVTEWTPGDRVMGLAGGGAYAEWIVADAGHVVRIPDGWTCETAAAVPEAFVTAHDALQQARLARGEHLLVHAVGSGVGVALLQLGRAIGASVTGTSRTEWKLQRARALGLDRAVLVADRFAPYDELRGTVNVTCDLVGGPYLPGTLDAMAPGGRIVVIGLTGGRSAEVNLGTVLAKRLTVIGTVLRSRSATEKRAVTRAFANEVLPLFHSGAVRPLVDRVFAMEEAAEAHRYMEANENFGAVVLTWGGGSSGTL